MCGQFLGHGCMNGLTAERRFDSQATTVIDALGLLFRSTGAGIKCLYCKCIQTQVHTVQLSSSFTAFNNVYNLYTSILTQKTTTLKPETEPSCFMLIHCVHVSKM